MKNFHIGRLGFLKMPEGYNNYSIGDDFRFGWEVGFVILSIGNLVIWWKTH